jgi:hypothetical protein
LSYKRTGQPAGRPPSADRLSLRPTIRFSPNIRSTAIFELATKKRGFLNVGYLLDDSAAELQSRLGLTQQVIDERALEILKRLKKA